MHILLIIDKHNIGNKSRNTIDMSFTGEINTNE